jgi:gamma-glutamylcyclotransferase (GGCT)/AIG2-like uncharacterized protein YtfP
MLILVIYKGGQMLEEITIPEEYTGTLEQENDIVGTINRNFAQIEKKIDEIGEEQMQFVDHIVDFDEYTIDLYYSDNKNKASIVLDDDILIVEIAGKEIRIDSDGNIV